MIDNLPCRDLAVLAALDGDRGFGRRFAAITDTMDLAIRMRGTVQVDAELGQGRNGEHGDETGQQLDQRLQVGFSLIPIRVMPDFGEPDNPGSRLH